MGIGTGCCVQESVMREVGNLRWGDFKPRLAEAMVEHLAPIRGNYAELMKVCAGRRCSLMSLLHDVAQS